MTKFIIFFNKTFTVVARILKGFRGVLRLFFHKEYWDVNKTYYTEYKEKQKNRVAIIWEQIKYTIKYQNPNKFYFLYGFDIKGLRNQEEYVDAFNVFSVVRDKLNNTLASPFVVLRDKSLFGIVAEAYGIPTPKNVGIIQNGLVYLYGEKTNIPLNQLFKQQIVNKDLFVKKTDGECADSVYHIVVDGAKVLYKGNLVNLETFFESDKRYLIQESIVNQHPIIGAFHKKSINTIRLCTAYNKMTKDVEIVSCVLRVGVGDNNVDNWAAGGLSIGVDTDNGTLREYGFYKPGFGTKATEHPDSHIVFKGCKIPFFKEAVDYAKAFHRHLYGIHSVGWDIAITEDGPCFVEGNDNWEISLMQISNHGLKKEFERLFN